MIARKSLLYLSLPILIKSLILIKMIAGIRSRPTAAVKDKQGVLRTEQSEKMTRWAEHFGEVLNRDDPDSRRTQ